MGRFKFYWLHQLSHPHLPPQKKNKQKNISLTFPGLLLHFYLQYNVVERSVYSVFRPISSSCVSLIRLNSQLYMYKGESKTSSKTNKKSLPISTIWVKILLQTVFSWQKSVFVDYWGYLCHLVILNLRNMPQILTLLPQQWLLEEKRSCRIDIGIGKYSKLQYRYHTWNSCIYPIWIQSFIFFFSLMVDVNMIWTSRAHIFEKVKSILRKTKIFE